jgi:hypothetical protein
VRVDKRYGAATSSPRYIRRWLEYLAGRWPVEYPACPRLIVPLGRQRRRGSGGDKPVQGGINVGWDRGSNAALALG